MARKFELEVKNKLESQIKVNRSSLPINVLLIEDSPGDVRMVQEMLAEASDVKFNLEHTDRLSSGLKLIANKEFDLVLLDLKLPDSCGFETFEKVEARIPETPIVVLTVLGEESVVTQALQAGAEDYLIKDRIDSDVLIRSIRYSIERKRAEVALRKAHDELEMKVQEKVQERTKELVRANEALQAEITERKQTEKALQETEERFASFMQHLPGAAWIKDIQGRYVYANKVAEKIFNTTLSELLGKTDDEIFPVDTASQFRGNDRHVIESGQNLQTIETLLQDDGIPHHSIVSKFPILDRNGALTMVGGIAIDITEWKRAEEKLTLYREIFDKSTDGIAIIDPKGYYIEQNRMHQSLVGYSDEELDGKTPAIHLGEEVFSKIGQELAKTGRYRGEVISHTKMGTLVPIELSAFTVRDDKDETICYVGIKRDITERKQAEEELSKFKFISDNSNDAHFFLDRNGRLLYVNKVACEKLGYSEDELLRMSVPDIDPDFDQAKLQNLFQLLQKEKVSPFESVHRRKDSSAFPVEISATGVEFNGMHYIFAVARDITRRKQRQEALQESESQLRLALEAGRMGIWDWNILTNKVIWSSNLEPIHGLAPSTFGGTYDEFLKIIHPEDYESVAQAITHAIETGGDYHIEFRNVWPDGSIHWMFAKGQVFYDETGKAVRMVGVATDITERKRAEEALRRSERELSDFFENAAIGLHWVGPDGRIIRVNRAELELLGYTHGEFVGHNVAEFYVDQDVINDILWRLKKGETLQNYEARLRCKDGSIKHVLIDSNALWENGRFIHSRCFTRDITASRKAEERFRLVVESAPNAIVMTDQQGMIIFANSQTEKLFGYTREELMGQTVETLVPERFRQRHPEYRSYFRSEPRVRPMGAGRDLYALRKDGTEFPVEIGLVPIQMDEGIVVLSSIVDITHRKQAEEQIKKSLREKEVLLKEIHHRVKNNLQIISSLLNLQSRNITGKKAREKFKESQNRVKSMALIHEKLYQSDNFEGIYFQEYIHSMLKYLFSSYGVDTSKIKLKINAHNILLSIDKAIPCGLIVNEIVSNSLKYAFPGGVQGEVYVDFRPDGDNYLLIVGNNGIPFSENVDFTKTKSLGLQLVCALVEQLRGTIELDRSSGAEFRIAFSP